MNRGGKPLCSGRWEAPGPLCLEPALDQHGTWPALRALPPASIPQLPGAHSGPTRPELRLCLGPPQTGLPAVGASQEVSAHQEGL